mmetsp:Transcript_2768/g.5761  ORF Transcript_2768/g.5761 Transcript_2768/m.5761 type:complete len:283 (+) Transcript_2768:109-957(+)
MCRSYQHEHEAAPAAIAAPMITTAVNPILPQPPPSSHPLYQRCISTAALGPRRDLASASAMMPPPTSQTSNGPFPWNVLAISDLCLIGDLLLRRLQVLLVREEVAGEQAHRALTLDRLEVLVELVHERDARRDLERGDLLVGDGVEALEDPPDRVAVGCDEDRLASLKGGRDVRVPVGQRALDRVLEALGEGDVRHSDVRILVIVPRPVGTARLDGRRRSREGAAPLLHLLVAVLGDGLLLVETCEPAVHALVEPPALVHRHLLLSGDLEYDLERLLRTLEK